MTDRLWLDIETYAVIDLKKVPVYRYVLDPEFTIIMASYSLNGNDIEYVEGLDDILSIPGLRDSSVQKVAHNAAFERVCFSHGLGLRRHTYLPPEEWEDTMVLAAELGYPKGLERLSSALGLEGKDTAGSALIRRFCRPNRKGERNMPGDFPLEWLDFADYNVQDVQVLMDVHRALEDKGGWPTEMEQRIYWADQHINDRGMKIDRPMAKLAMHAAYENQTVQKARVTELTGVANPNSVPQMGAWMRAQKFASKPTDLKAATIEQLLLKEILTPEQKEVLQLRQELALAAPAKYGTALESMGKDARLRGSFRFYGAHTGRWSGVGTQVQNLPRLSYSSDNETEAAVLDLKLDEPLSTVDLKKLVRSMFIGPLTVVDYSSIEARVVAWLANEEWALEAFRAGRDIYVETAERMGGLTRAQGKIAVLALGYNGGTNSLRALAGDREALEQLAKPGHEGHLTHEEIEEGLQFLVDQWRAANPRICALWNKVDAGFRKLGSAGPILQFEKEDRDRIMRLPSGRMIAYRDCKPGAKKFGQSTITFISPQTGFRTSTYGGRLTENATQGVARDIMAEAIVRLEERGFPVVGHVHDEIIVEGHHDVEEIKAIMCEQPEWAPGLPIDGAGFNCTRYRKG